MIDYSKTNVVLTGILLQLSQDELDISTAAMEGYSGEESDTSKGRLKECVVDAVSALVAKGVDEKAAISAVQQFAKDLAEEHGFPEFPDDNASDEDIEAWLEAADELDFIGHLESAVEETPA